MKNIFKTIFKPLFICLVLTLSGCEAEKDLTKEEKITIRRFSMKELSNKTDSRLMNAMNKIKNIQSPHNESAKIVFDEKSGLYIDDEKGLYIEKDGASSYTFPVIRGSDGEKVQNVCFNQKANGNFDVYLVQYDFTKEQADALSEEELQNREKQFVSLMKDGVVVEEFRYVCIDVVLYSTQEIAAPIDQGELTGNNGNNFTSQTTVVTLATSCFFTSDNPGVSGSGIGTGSGSDGGLDGGGLSNGGGQIITGSIIDDTVPSGGELPLGWAISYFENSLDEFQLPVYRAHPELRDYLAANNCDYDSREFVVQMIAAFESEDYTQEQKETISELIIYSINNNSTFTIDNSVTNPLFFNNVEELANFNTSNEGTSQGLDGVELANQDDEYIGTYKFKLTLLGGVEVYVKFTQNPIGTPMRIIDVTSEHYGTIFGEWKQTLYSKHRLPNNKIRIDVIGGIYQNFNIAGVPINSHSNYHLTVIIDASSAGVESSSWSHN